MTETLTKPDAENPEPGHLHQTFLVGDEIYLRPVEKDDATLTVSWRPSLLPFSPERTENWIEEDLAKGRQSWHVIVRKADDRVVGSVTFRSRGPATYLEGYVDPFYGAQGERWKADAFRLVLPWLVDEQHRVSLQISVPANETQVIAALEEAGARQTARFRQMLSCEGQRIDQLRFEYLNRQWVARLGDPNAQEIARAGSGVPRPVPAPVRLEGDPPKNAIAVGERVYLKPIDKEDAEEMARWTRRETEGDFGVPRLLASMKNKIESRLDGQNDKVQGTVGFAIRLRKTDETLGDVALLDVNYFHRFAETGSWIYKPQFRGGGYGTEAKHLLLGYAFDTLGLHSVRSHVAQANLRSAAALRKQGYREAGRLNWIESTNGGYTGDLVFDLLADEWRALERET